MKKFRYYVINIIVFLITVILFARIVVSNFIWLYEEGEIVPIFLLTAVCIIAIHFIKALRLYFIMLETRLTLERFFKVYIKTMLVNLVFPFKLGELFRMYCFGSELKSIKRGILLILIDRYFDTVPLMLLLLSFTLFCGDSIKGIVIILLCFLVVVTIIYGLFPSTFKYLNRFFIVKTSSEKGIIALGVLKKMQLWFLYIQELIKGRELILLILSCLVWMLEYGALYCLIRGVGHDFLFTDFIIYMNGVFVGNGSKYIGLYIGISAVILAGMALVICGMNFIKRRGN